MFTVLKSARLYTFVVLPFGKGLHRPMAVKTRTQNLVRRFWLVGVPKTSVEPWVCPLHA